MLDPVVSSTPPLEALCVSPEDTTTFPDADSEEPLKTSDHDDELTRTSPLLRSSPLLKANLRL
jgi:hypothetical protein